MKMFSGELLRFAASALVIAALAGCAQESAEGSRPTQPEATAQAARTAQLANNEPLAPRYSATLAEGISFAKAGYPDFISGVSGVSGPEEWGRWTDANLAPSAKFQFKEPLPANLTLKLKVRDFFGVNATKEIKVQVGEQQKTFILEAGRDQEVVLAFEGLSGVNTVEISAPSSSEPTATDSRRMGLGLIYLQIQG